MTATTQTCTGERFAGFIAGNFYLVFHRIVVNK